MSDELPDNDILNGLLNRAKEGDRIAAGALYDELMPMAYRFFMARTRDVQTAEELSERTLLALIQQLAKFDEKTSLANAWFWRLTQEIMAQYDSSMENIPLPQFKESAFETSGTRARS